MAERVLKGVDENHQHNQALALVSVLTQSFFILIVKLKHFHAYP